AREQELQRPGTLRPGDFREPDHPRRFPENHRRVIRPGAVVEFARVDLPGLDVKTAEHVDSRTQYVRRDPERAIERTAHAVRWPQPQHMEPDGAEASHVGNFPTCEEDALWQR